MHIIVIIIIIIVIIIIVISPFVGSWPLSQFLCYTQWLGLLGRGISPSQGLYTQNTNTDIHALSEIRTHDYSCQAGEDSSRLRPRGHCDRRCILPALRKLGNSSWHYMHLCEKKAIDGVIKLRKIFRNMHTLPNTWATRRQGPEGLEQIFNALMYKKYFN
jgi:hypothetical protein